MGADEEPVLQVQIEGKQMPMLVDTGATYTCVGPKKATLLPLSEKFTETVGFFGIKRLIPMTAPVKITTKEAETKIPLLLSSRTPIILLGRDALCELKIKISCSPSGVYIDKECLDYQMMMQKQVKKAKVYLLGEMLTPVTQVLEKQRKIYPGPNFKSLQVIV